jgi:hypothetical protein
MRKVLPRHRGASAAWHSARVCRLLRALLRATREPRAKSCPGNVRAEEKVGQPLGSDRPIAERPSYFFFAFLAFLAAFFAFFAIVPPEGSGSCLDGDFGMSRTLSVCSLSQSFTSRCLSLTPSYQM